MPPAVLQGRRGATTAPWWSPGTFSGKAEIAIHQTISAACTSSLEVSKKVFKVFDTFPWWRALPILALVAVTVIMLRIIYKRLTRDGNCCQGGQSYSYSLLGKVQNSFEHAKGQIPDDYQLLASLWLAAGLQFVDVISDMQAIAVMLLNPDGHGYALTNIAAIFLLAPLVSHAGSRGQRHPVLPSASRMLLCHILQVPGPVLAVIATRQILWSPLRGKTELRQDKLQEDVQASADEYEALRAIQAEVTAVGLTEATIEGTTSMLVQALFLLQEETTGSAKNIYASLLISLLSTAKAYAETDKEGKVVRSIKHPERKEAQVDVAVVAGRVPVASKAYALLIMFRALDIASFMSSLLLLHYAIKQRWWPRSQCPALASLLLGAFLARLLLFVSQNREAASVHRAATSLVSFAGPIMLPLSYPFIGLPAACFYAWRFVEVLSSGGLIFWIANYAEMTQSLPVTWTWVSASIAMWPACLAVAWLRPALSQEPAAVLKESYLDAVLSADLRPDDPFDPWPWWLRSEQDTYLAQLPKSPHPSKAQESDPEPEVFRSVAALTCALRCDRSLKSAHLKPFSANVVDDCLLIADGLRHCPQLRSIDLCNSRLGQAATAIADSLQHCPHLQSLNLSHTELGPEGTKAIANGLRQCPQLASLDLSDSKIGLEGAKALADCLHHWPLLNSLTLGDNTLDYEGVKAIAGGMRHCPLMQSLHLWSDHEVAGAIADCFQHCPQLKSLRFKDKHLLTGARALVDGLQQCPQLSSLDLSSNDLGPEGAKAIADGLARWPQLQSLDLQSCGLDLQGAQALRDGLQRCPQLRSLRIGGEKNNAFAIADVLQCCTQLHSLFLEYTKLDNEKGARQAIADGLLRLCPQLQSLDLSFSSLGDEGAQTLAESLKRCPQLKSLNLWATYLGPVGAMAIADGLQHWPQLQSLNLGGNKFGAEGTNAIADGIQYCPQLRSLSLRSTELGTEGAKAIVHGLEHCSQLQTLDLSSQNDIDNEGAKTIADSLQHWPQLRSLDLHFNKVGDEGADALASCLMKHCPHLKSIDLNTNAIMAPSSAIWTPYLMSSSSLRSVYWGATGRSSLATSGGMTCCESQLRGVEELQFEVSQKTPNLMSSFLQSQLHRLSSVRQISLGCCDAAGSLPQGLIGEGFSRALQYLPHLRTLVIRRIELRTQGAQAVADGVQHCLQLQSLTIRESYLDLESGKAIANALQHCPQLQSLDLHVFDGGGEFAKALADYLQHCPQLRSLSLSDVRIRPEGAKAFADGLQHWPQLQSLDLSRNLLYYHGAQEVADGLVWHCPQLQSLDLRENNIGLEGAKVIADCLQRWPKLQTLDLSHNRFGAEGAQAVADGLQHCLQLQSLSLSGNPLQAGGAEALAGSLKQHCPQLQCLRLYDCRLDHGGAKAIADCVQHCQQLESLHLGGNPLDASGAKTLADGLQRCPHLQSLDLCWCLPDNEGARAIAEGLQHWPQLQFLNLCACSLGPVGATAIADGLQHCPQLESLNLEETALGPEGAKVIADGLQHCPQLQYLVLRRNGLGLEGAKAIVDGLRHCSQLQSLHLGRNELDAEGAMAVSDSIQRWPQLQSLKLRGYNCDWARHDDYF